MVLCERYGVDAIRYFLLRDIPFGSDGTFSNEALITRINSDLANDLGNLVSRTVAMVNKYFGGTIPTERTAGEFDEDLIALATATKAKVEAYADEMQFSQRLRSCGRSFPGRINISMRRPRGCSRRMRRTAPVWRL